MQKIDAFELWCWKILESPLDCREIQPVHPKGDQSWVFIGSTDVEAETPIRWPPDVKIYYNYITCSRLKEKQIIKCLTFYIATWIHLGPLCPLEKLQSLLLSRAAKFEFHLSLRLFHITKGRFFFCLVFLRVLAILYRKWPRCSNPFP